jgi:mono/diheme cytochrome c family protein
MHTRSDGGLARLLLTVLVLVWAIAAVVAAANGASPAARKGVTASQAAPPAAATAPSLAGSVAAQDATVAKGMQVYADQKCSLCHSIAGKGNTKGALDGVGSKLKVDDIRAWMVNPAEMTQQTKADRKPAMRAYPNLPKDDLDALVAYMFSLKKK